MAAPASASSGTVCTRISRKGPDAGQSAREVTQIHITDARLVGPGCQRGGDESLCQDRAGRRRRDQCQNRMPEQQ